MWYLFYNFSLNFFLFVFDENSKHSDSKDWFFGEKILKIHVSFDAFSITRSRKITVEFCAKTFYKNQLKFDAFSSTQTRKNKFWYFVLFFCAITVNENIF